MILRSSRGVKRETVDYIVPERLKEARIYRGLTVEEAAKLLNMTKGEIYKWENGTDCIEKKDLFKIMSAYNFPRMFFYHLKWERT